MLGNNEIILLIILGLVVLTNFIIPMYKVHDNGRRVRGEVKKKLEKFEDSSLIGSNLMNSNLLEAEMPSLDSNMCSQECCKQTQWPVPHDVGPKAGADFIGNNMSCNHGTGSGCLCVTKKDFNYLSSRGNNTSSKIEDTSVNKCS